MTPAALIDVVSRLGVALTVDGADLVHRGPRGALKPELFHVLKANKAAVIAELRRREQTTRACPCPTDIAERGAIIAEGDGCDRVTADGRALAEHGVPSWRALADAHRERILGHLAGLPPPINDHGRRLLSLTRAFLESEHWQAAVALGWELVELFGIHPHAPLTHPGGRGLVPLIALSAHSGARLEVIEPAGAVFCTKSGARQTYTLGMHDMAAAVLWWECNVIIGGN